ncbi:MAG: AlpA family phage regulatory protein [Deltaproteobacteria bacterium]|nr:AlpA family phage regulatory protein [Deltaproteobacteria bacterium]MBW1995345.1 AlpA family phage regulatory protein [Deltaproteobacteria bacterium]
MRFLNRQEVVEKTGVSPVTLWRWERAGIFPPRRRIGMRRVGWLDTEIQRWMETRERVEPISESQDGGRAA